MLDRSYRVFFGFYDIFPVKKGSTVRTRNLFSRIPGIEVTIFTKKKVGQKETERDPPFTIIRVPLTKELPFKQSVEFMMRLKDHFHREEKKHSFNFDIWHCRSPFDGYFLSQEAERRNQPMIFEVNGLPSIEWPYHYPRIQKKHKKAFKRLSFIELLTAFAATHIVVPSHVTKEYLVARDVPRKKITVIPNGASNNFRFRSMTPEARQRLLDLPSGWEKRVLIGYIGAFQPWQGLHDLIEALPQLPKDNSWGVILIGKSKAVWRHKLRKIAKQLEVRENILFRKPLSLSEMPSVLNCFDIAAAPLADTPRNTVQGCNPIKLYEYAASGLPIVASDLPVVREILEPNECLLTPPNDPEELGKALKNLIENSDERLVLQKRVLAGFKRKSPTWEKRSHSLHQLYQLIMRNN